MLRRCILVRKKDVVQSITEEPGWMFLERTLAMLTQWRKLHTYHFLSL